MQKIAIIQISEAGERLAHHIRQELSATHLSRQEVGREWKNYDAFVFIGALGICVRTIAPYIEDKHSDPAVVCVDSMGQHAVSVLSGHIGGANELTQTVASATGALPVVTTQSDCAGLWALDTLGQRFGWTMETEDLNHCIQTFVNGQPTALLLEIRDEGTDYLEHTLPPYVTLIPQLKPELCEQYRLLIVVSPWKQSPIEGIPMLQFIPRVMTAGIGLAHQASPIEEIEASMLRDLDAAGIAGGLSSIQSAYTIDVKREEPFVQHLQENGIPVGFFTSEELSAIDVPTPSEVVAKHVGTPSVSEASALLGSEHGKLVMPKQKGSNYTLSVAIARPYLRQGHVEIVGAGPGDPDLVSVRGRKMLEQADLILYAGSLVPRALTQCAKPGAIVRSSASMTLEEQCELMKTHYDKGKYIVRLHTGDPSIFGAIQEQMAFFDHHQMDYHITPGISSFLAAAAELRSQFTIPERCQTIILTRGEGRTPMPEREKLHLLARSRSTMCIFLSAAIVDDVQRELLQEYPEDTPVAACYRLTWPDQRIYCGQLKDLAQIIHDHHLTLTTMLVVGDAIDNRHGLSALYSKHFTHLFRKGDA